MLVVEPATPPAKMPMAMSPDVPLVLSREIILLATSVVPEATPPTQIPATDQVEAGLNRSILFLVIEALGTSLFSKVVFTAAAVARLNGVVPPRPRPQRVVAVLLPTSTQLRTVTFVAGVPVRLRTHITEAAVPASVLVTVRSRVEVVVQ